MASTTAPPRTRWPRAPELSRHRPAADRRRRRGAGRLDAAGFRGVRFNFMGHLGRHTPIEEVLALADRFEPLGWHLQIHGDPALLTDLAPHCGARPTPVVIDHIGRIDASLGPGPAGLPGAAGADGRRALLGQGQRHGPHHAARARLTPMRSRLPGRWSRSSAIASCGATTGRIPITPGPFPTSSNWSISSPRSRRPSSRGKRCWSQSATALSIWRQHMSPRFENKVAIVTGAGCVGAGWGNGRAIAVRLAEEGAKVLRGGPRPRPARRNARTGRRRARIDHDLGLRRDQQRQRRRHGGRLRRDLRHDRRPGQQRRWLGRRRPGGDGRGGVGLADRHQSQERLPDLQARAADDAGQGRRLRSSTSRPPRACAGPAARRWRTPRPRPA